MSAIDESLEAAEVVVIGTPIYWYGPTGPTKLLLDRLRPYFGNRRLSGKSLALLLPAGTGAPDCDLTIEMFRRACEALGMTFLVAVTAEAYDMGEVDTDPEVAQALDALAATINADA